MKIVGLFVGMVTALAVVPAAVGVPSSKRAVIIGDHLYFTDTTAERNRTEALEYCVGEEAELAKINGNIYDQIRLGIPESGSYWIDGIDKTTGDRFDVTTDCTVGDGRIDFTGIPDENLDISAVSCLKFVKGSKATSKIQSVGCNMSLGGVLCSFPLNGCDVESTTADAGP